jgi:hypothetical protein
MRLALHLLALSATAAVLTTGSSTAIWTNTGSAVRAYRRQARKSSRVTKAVLGITLGGICRDLCLGSVVL